MMSTLKNFVFVGKVSQYFWKAKQNKKLDSQWRNKNIVLASTNNSE